jgi:hypothetical protein
MMVMLALALAGCGDGGGGVAGTGDAGPGEADAARPDLEFDHFEFTVSPTVPLQDQIFEVEVIAYSSADDSERMSGYNGVVTLTSSIGSLTGNAVSKDVSNGRVAFEVSLDAAALDVVLTATDDEYPTITGDSAPFYVSPPGDTATALQVIISEVNWFGNSSASTDEWIEIRNVSGGEINLSEWTLEGAGTTGTPLMQFDNGTSLADGDYLVLARTQGADTDGERTSLTGVSPVQIQTMELANAGEALILRDVEQTLIDQTPAGAWPAGDNANDLSMERRDDVNGGGYTDGSLAGAWYSWSSLDSVQTSNAATSDQGTPGATNSHPDLFDHFTIDIQPTSPKSNIDFTATVTAYSSTDDSVVATGYDGLISLSISAGTLTGEATNQAITAGTTTLTLRTNQPGAGTTLTVDDSIYPHITGTTPPFVVLPEGDPSGLRQVVISEVNYFGNDANSADEWIEIRNLSGTSLNLADWTVESAGPGSDPITIGTATILADGEYLLLADRQGPDVDGMRTSLTGVANVQIASLSLLNGGEHLVLRDVEGTLIDETPDPGWPAGNDDTGVDYSMERRDNSTGGGYTDGALDGAWYTWSSIDGTNTTHADSSDSGTPGADNTNPDLFDHFTLSVNPTSPIVGQDFTLTVRAFSSVDDSVPLTAYNGTISVTEAVTGSLSGEVDDQPITAGVASLTLQFDRLTSALALTVTDDIYSDMSATTANFTVIDTGDTANLRDVVINEVNWFGNAVSNDEWVELRNRSGASLDLSGWTIDGLGAGTEALVIDSNTILADGGYLVIGDRQGADLDGSRTSLTGVANVQVQSAVALSNGGDSLTLRDIAGTLVDETPAGVWPAGDSGSDRSMERRDEITGGGYTDGSVAGAWYTWNPFGNSDTTSPDTSDQGTPGADNSDPDAILPPLALPYTTGFETSDPNFENLVTGGFSNTPPAGTVANNGVAIATTDSVTTSLTGRQLQSVDCLILNDDTTTVNASASASASSNNGATVLRARIKLLWFTDAGCTTPHAVTPNSVVTSTTLVQGSYTALANASAPPTGATHLKIRVEVADDASSSTDAYAVDDVSVTQP